MSAIVTMEGAFRSHDHALEMGPGASLALLNLCLETLMEISVWGWMSAAAAVMMMMMIDDDAAAADDDADDDDEWAPWLGEDRRRTCPTEQPSPATSAPPPQPTDHYNISNHDNHRQ